MNHLRHDAHPNDLIADVLDAPQDAGNIARVRERVAALTKRFPVYG